jgi:hypothetical protein
MEYFGPLECLGPWGLVRLSFIRIEWKKEIHSLVVTVQDWYPSKPNAKFNWTGALLTPVVSVTEYHGEILERLGFRRKSRYGKALRKMT